MARILWKLPEYLEKHNLTPLQVERESVKAGAPLGKNSIYRLIKDDGPSNVNRNSLAAIINALRSLTGEEVTPNDLLEYTPQ